MSATRSADSSNRKRRHSSAMVRLLLSSRSAWSRRTPSFTMGFTIWRSHAVNGDPARLPELGDVVAVLPRLGDGPAAFLEVIEHFGLDDIVGPIVADNSHDELVVRD